MDKHTKKTPSLFRYPVLVAFGLFFIGLFVLDMATPDRAYSELENTTLTQRPRLTAVSADGLNNYFTSYTRYVKDQVFGRDQWISLQSAAETTLFQKTQSGGRVNLMLVPSASVVYPENVPAGAPQIDEKGILEGVAAQGEAYGRFIDVLPALTEHKGEYLYYRTDHHWTTLGAYYAYQQLCETLGLTPFDRDAHTAETCEDFYGTHYSKARTWNAEPDTITWYDLQNSLTVWNVTGPGQPTEGTTTGLYDLDKLKVYDKYAMFLHGNNGLSRVEGDGEGKILVIKDSYANSFVPYLTANYAAIDVVDFRNYNYGLDQLIAANDYDQILVLYSYASFTTDPYLYRAGVAG